ncbi:MAG TPA: hypothetical protein VJB67_00095 [Patescibacteria group bacterium]|nr:hypothetical protein [Patescibacteria group bacterium]
MIIKDISQVVLETIKNQDIKPKPKWQFLLKDYIFWLIAGFSILIGSLSVAVMIFMAVNSDWDIRFKISHSFFGFVLMTLPYFWLLILIIFIFLVYYNFRHTQGGYKYQLISIAIGSIIISVVFGFLFYSIGLGGAIDDIFYQRLPAVHCLMNPQQLIWDQPEHGRLGGVIIRMIDQSHFELVDIDRELWKIDYREAENLEDFVLNEGLRVKIIGEIINDNNFKAIMIRSQIRPPGFMMGKFKESGMVESGFERKFRP